MGKWRGGCTLPTSRGPDRSPAAVYWTLRPHWRSIQFGNFAQKELKFLHGYTSASDLRCTRWISIWTELILSLWIEIKDLCCSNLKIQSWFRQCVTTTVHFWLKRFNRTKSNNQQTFLLVSGCSGEIQYSVYNLVLYLI